MPFTLQEVSACGQLFVSLILSAVIEITIEFNLLSSDFKKVFTYSLVCQYVKDLFTI